MKIIIGHTPDADDAFMFYGLFTGKVNSNFTFSHVIEDIEKLNERAINSELDVTAISVSAYSYLKNYTILQSGGSFGINYGPIVIAKKKITINKLNNLKIAIPGKLTSAFLLLRLMIGEFKFKMINFNEIPNVIKKEDVDAGLIIHETQLSYKLEGLIKIVDVGKWWYKKTGLPVPLGINVMKNKFSHDIMIEFDNCLRRSIEYGLNHMEDAVDYAMKYNRNKPKNIITKFVKMYVNDITINMGESGKKSIIHLFNLAKKNNIIKNEFKIKII